MYLSPDKRPPIGEWPESPVLEKKKITKGLEPIKSEPSDIRDEKKNTENLNEIYELLKGKDCLDIFKYLESVEVLSKKSSSNSIILSAMLKYPNKTPEPAILKITYKSKESISYKNVLCI